MSTLRVTNVQDTAGANSLTTAQIYSGAAKAWVNFNGDGTVAIRASFNVSSITDIATGDYTITFTTALTDANGTAAGSAVETVGTFTGGQRAVMCSFSSASALRTSVTFQNGGVADCPFVGVAIFR